MWTARFGGRSFPASGDGDGLPEDPPAGGRRRAHQAGALVVERPAGNEELHGGRVVARAEAVVDVEGVGRLDRRHVDFDAQARALGQRDLAADDLQRLAGQALAVQHGLGMAPHFVMEIHIHMAAAYAGDTWVEHFEWLEPVFNERLEIRDGRMIVPERPGLGLSLSRQAAAWTLDTFEAGARS